MKPALITDRTPTDKIALTCTLGARMLIGLTTLLLLAMPWTEYLWHFDNFLRGGQDFEFGLLSITTIFCLVLVISQKIRQGLNLILAVRKWLSVLLHEAVSPLRGGFHGRITALHPPSQSGPALGMYGPPIRI